MALLHFLLNRADRDRIALSALTCEHGIRGEASRADLAFVESLCRDWNVPLTVFRKDVPALAQKLGCGLEEAGRTFRYDCFSAVVQNGQADAVATAHHLNDYAETLLFRISRGTALAGLNAFPARQGVVRPLLHTTRAQIDEYIRDHHLPFVEDESNADTSYTRNALRHNVLPALERAVPDAAQNIVRFAERATKDDEFLQSLADQAVRRTEREIYVPLSLPAPVLSRACLAAVKSCGVTRDYTESLLLEILSLQEKQSGKKVPLSTGWEVLRERDDLVFHLPDQPATPEFPFSLGTITTPHYTLTVSEGRADHALNVDLDRFPQDCVVRTRREGDRFTPCNGHSKTLKKYLTDQKIPARIGKELPLIACENDVLAIGGVELSDTVKITETTTRFGSISTVFHTYNLKTEK